MGLTRNRSKNRADSRNQYITNPKTLQYIAQTVDQACQQAPENSVQSFEDFKELVEDQSNQKVGVDICKIDGVVRSFRFYLQNKPHQTTTSSYLAKGTGQDSGEYSPQSIANYFGFDQNVDEFDDELNNSVVQKLGLDPDQGYFDDDDFDDDNFLDADSSPKDEFKEDINNQSRRRNSLTKFDQQSNLNSNDNFDNDDFDDDNFDDDNFDDDSVISDDEWLNQKASQLDGIYAGAVEQLDDADAVNSSNFLDSGSTDNFSLQNDPINQVIRDASFVAQQAATQGSEVSGVNLIGDAASGTLMGIALLNQLLTDQEKEDENNPYIDRIRALLESYEKINKSFFKLEKQAHQLQERLKKNTLSVAQADLQNFEDLSPRISQVAQQFDSFNPRVGKLEARINNLEEKLNVETPDSSTTQSSLSIFEESDDIDTRLDKLEAYAKHLNKRIDQFEGRLNRLQKIVDNLAKQQNQTQIIDDVEFSEQFIQKLDAQFQDVSNLERKRNLSGKAPYRIHKKLQVEL